MGRRGQARSKKQTQEQRIEREETETYRYQKGINRRIVNVMAIRECKRNKWKGNGQPWI